MKILVLLMFLASSHAFSESSDESSPYEQNHTQGISFMNAYGDEDNGYCVVMEDVDGNIQEVITVDGALDRKQLRSALRYLSYKEHWVIGAAIPSSALLLAIVLPLAGGVVGAAELATSSYQLFHGLGEEETLHALTASSSTIGPFSFLAEHLIRSSRERALTEDDRRLTFKNREELKELDFPDRQKMQFLHQFYLGQKKQNKIIERLQEIVPAHESGCDHLKGRVVLQAID